MLQLGAKSAGRQETGAPPSAQEHKMIRIDLVDPREHCETISNLLKDCWLPPCVAFTPDYVRWHLEYPASRPPIAVIGYEDDVPMTVSCLMPREMRVGKDAVTLHLASFAAVREEWRSQAGSVPRVMFRKERELNASVITFCEIDSPAEKWTLELHRLGGYRTYHICTLPLHGFASREAAPGDVRVEPTTDPVRFLAATAQLRNDRVIWHDIDTAAFEHILRDPRQAVPVVAYAASGKPLATAVVVRSEIRTAAAITWSPALHSISMPEPDPLALKALCCFARDHYGPCEGGSVMIPNVLFVDDELRRLAGMRRLRGGYNCYISTVDLALPPLAGRGTNMEVI